MTKATEGSKRTLWFSKEQNDVINELKEITGDANSKIVRDALNLYMKQVKGK